MDSLLTSLISYLQENYKPSDTLFFTLPSPIPPKKAPASILLLTHPKEKEFLPFFTSLATAIEQRFAACQIIDIQAEKNFISPALLLLLVSKSLFFQSPHLLSSYHRGTPPTLFNIPLLLLPDLSLLSTQKEEKKNLWNLIHQHVAP